MTQGNAPRDRSPVRLSLRQKIRKSARRSRAWLRFEQSLLRGPAERNREGIEAVAAVLRASPLFDAEAYAAQTSCRELGFDPAFHYVLSGEREGYATPDFDPTFYAARYGDARSSGINRLFHFITVGQSECRYASKKMHDAPFPSNVRTDDRPIVYVVCHEASRTGAPILGWNLCRLLRQDYFVVAIIFRGGNLLDAFAAHADLVITAPSVAFDRKALIDQVISKYPASFAIVNSLYSSKLVPDLVAANIPFVGLVQEFAPPERDPEMQLLFSTCGALVFASDLVMKGSVRYYDIDPSKCFLQPQGQSLLPPITATEKGRSATRAETQAALESLLSRKPRPFIVAGIGSTEARKGVDLFLSTATSLKNMRPDLDVRFLWIGNRSKSPQDASFIRDLDEQIEKSALGDRFLQLRPTEDLGAIYEAMNVLYLCSRLDPMPNVAIDAALVGKPVLCFEGATGFADLLRTNGIDRLSLPYLDLVAATNAIIDLAEDPDATMQLGTRVRAMAQSSFVMQDYVALIERLGRELADARASA